MHAVQEHQVAAPEQSARRGLPQGGPAGLLSLQRMAGNRAVQTLVAAQRTAAVQRDEAPAPTGGAAIEDQGAMCAGGTVTVTPITVEEGDEGTAPVQTLTLQRDDTVPKPGGAKAASTAPACPMPTGWGDFTDKPGGDGSGLAAGTPMSLNGFKDGNFVVVFDKAGAWVDTNLVAKAGTRLPKTQARVDGCNAGFQKGDTSHTSTGQTKCPASKSTSRSAKNAGECETVIGAGFDAEDKADLPRLLTHEQYHSKLVCAMANKAAATLPAGTKKVTQQVATVYKNLGAVLQPTIDQYDADSKNGCDASGQATWQSKVDKGDVPIAPK